METSNINSLPNDFHGGVGDKNVNKNSQVYDSNIQMQTSEIPGKDVHLNTENMTRDSNTKVNFVPESENDVYYIPSKSSSFENKQGLFSMVEGVTVEDLKLPIIVGVLFVLFQLPTVRVPFQGLFKGGFDENNQITTMGIYVLGVIFSGVFFFISKALN